MSEQLEKISDSQAKVKLVDTDGNGLSKDGILAASEEAAKQPTMFNPRERINYIRQRVKEIRALRALNKNDIEIKEVLGTFVTDYPTLFQKAVEPNFNEYELNLMLGVMDKMATTGMSQHQASVIIGQRLVDTYVKPQLKGVAPTKK
jgi:hypothetical protein